MPSRASAWCALALIFALYVVGFVSRGVLRHLVQTAPVWLIVYFGWRRSESTKWMAIPCFVFWLFLMSLIWLFLMGWSHLISGTFSPIEIAMTLVVGATAIAGLVDALRTSTSVREFQALAISAAFLLVQGALFFVSFLPAIAHD